MTTQLDKLGRRKRKCIGSSRIRPDGYTRREIEGVRKLIHNWVWIIYNGRIPKGSQVHHKNGVRSDNRLENLELVSIEQHTFKHRKLKIIEGVVYKYCSKCQEWKIRKECFYFKKTANCFGSECRPCVVDRSTISKGLKKAVK
jgi:hypothetical protein